MNSTFHLSNIFSIVFALLLVAIGLLNLILIHPVPGIAYLLLSLIYLPANNPLLKNRFGFTIPWPVKILLGIALIMFTLGVSGLGDMMDNL